MNEPKPEIWKTIPFTIPSKNNKALRNKVKQKDEIHTLKTTKRG